MRAKLVASELVGGWFIDLWNNGTIEFWPMKPNKMFCKIYPNQDIRDDIGVPEFVRRAVYHVRDKNRATQRLHLSYRLGALFGKPVKATRGWSFARLKLSA